MNLLQPTDEQREELARAIAELTATMQASAAAFVQVVVPAVQAAAQQFAILQQQLQAAGFLDASGKPARLTDRPAWQTPYGPPARRH
ncbi:hypothetical protein ACFYS8_13350 [Kitasatospora sp. NPDC004615]|uniref:hypothetical protein n=1 Tax=unclassified Kitasatospora TaxID=2633591 RepID=UPI00368AA89E